MSVDVTRIPGQCRCGKHWYQFSSSRWYITDGRGMRVIVGTPACAAPGIWDLETALRWARKQLGDRRGLHVRALEARGSYQP